jgi:hypothetical protein
VADLDFIMRVLRVFSDADDADYLWWKAAGEGVEFFVMCNDVFAWGTADAEPITPENIGELEQAYRDAGKACGDKWGTNGALLFVARQRKMRPQGAYYKSLEEAERPLFDACGPYRPAGFGNPTASGQVA